MLVIASNRPMPQDRAELVVTIREDVGHDVHPLAGRTLDGEAPIVDGRADVFDDDAAGSRA